jgi:hypothetical protein
VEVNLYYQTTSREYIEFLRDEINGTGNLTLTGTGAGGDPPYIIQSDPFFGQLKAWGDTIWGLWIHNIGVDGARPFLMTQASVESAPACTAPVPTLPSATPGHQQVALTWSDEHSADPSVVRYNVYYDQAGKAQFIAEVGLNTTYTDSGLTNGQEYCYKVTSFYDTTCESGFSNILCAIPNNQGQARVGVNQLETGRYETTGQGKNKTTIFVLTDTLNRGDGVVIRAHVVDASTGLPVANAAVDIAISGPEIANLTTDPPSDTDGVAEATWQTQSPNKKGQGGTTPGTYIATVTNVTADGYNWDSVTTSATFTLQ